MYYCLPWRSNRSQCLAYMTFFNLIFVFSCMIFYKRMLPFLRGITLRALVGPFKHVYTYSEKFNKQRMQIAGPGLIDDACTRNDVKKRICSMSDGGIYRKRLLEGSIPLANRNMTTLDDRLENYSMSGEHGEHTNPKKK